jgi:hypothetical protein
MKMVDVFGQVWRVCLETHFCGHSTLSLCRAPTICAMIIDDIYDILNERSDTLFTFRVSRHPLEPAPTWSDGSVNLPLESIFMLRCDFLIMTVGISHIKSTLV